MRNNGLLVQLKTFFADPLIEDDPEKQQDVRTTHRVCVALLGIGIFSIPMVFLLTSPVFEITLGATFGVLFVWLFAIYLVKIGKVNLVKGLILGINTINLFGVTYGIGGFEYPSIFTTIFLLTLANLLFPKRGAAIYGAVLIALALLLLGANMAGIVPPPPIKYSASGTFFLYLFLVVSSASILTIASLNAQKNLDAAKDNAARFQAANEALTQLRHSLEQQIGERTKDLEARGIELSARGAELETAVEKIEHRAVQFRAIAEVARTVAATKNLSDLLIQVAHYISDQFGFYHVGIFLIDNAKEYALLSAANSEGGQRMLARGHKLKVGETGIVGYAAAANKPHVALDAGQDAVHFDNPDLPDTRSEMALPLTRTGEVIGVLDIQSTEANAFSNEDVEILSVLADQISIAIQNTQLYEESQKSLAEIDTIYRQYLKREWKGYAQQGKIAGYHYSITGSMPIENASQFDALKLEAEGIAVPINLRNEQIGTLKIKTPDDRKWSKDELDLIRAVADRVALSAENARLFDDANTRAERERAVSEITSKIRSTNDPAEMIQTAIQELQQALNVKQIRIVPLTPPIESPDRNPEKSERNL